LHLSPHARQATPGIRPNARFGHPMGCCQSGAVPLIVTPFDAGEDS